NLMSTIVRSMPSSSRSTLVTTGAGSTAPTPRKVRFYGFAAIMYSSTTFDKRPGYIVSERYLTQLSANIVYDPSVLTGPSGNSVAGGWDDEQKIIADRCL